MVDKSLWANLKWDRSWTFISFGHTFACGSLLVHSRQPGGWEDCGKKLFALVVARLAVILSCVRWKGGSRFLLGQDSR